MRTISTQKLEEMRDDDQEFFLVNVLPEKDHEQEHIPGSINIPAKNIPEQAEGKFGPEDEIVVYCASAECKASEDAARELQQAGFGDVEDYVPGIEGWKKSGNSTIGSEV